MLWAVPAAAQQAGGAAPTITVGASPSTDMSLMIIAVKKGFLEKEGLNAQLQLFDSSPAALQGVVAGRADITNNTEPPQLGARARGGKVVQIMTGYTSGRINGLVVNGEVIKKPQDFVGKAVGVQRGSGANYHLAWFLERNKLPADKVAVKYMDAPDQIPALARGDIQAFFFLLSPLRARKKGDYPITSFVHLSLGTYMEEQDHILLSAQLMTDREVDEVVDSLKKELDEFGKAAKRELKELHEKMLQR